jgi:CHAD domain-containing protein
MNVTRKSPDARAVHDLRVSIRRFNQALGVFKASFPGRESRRIRRRAKKLMVLAGVVRNCDIALKLLSKFRDAESADLRAKLQRQRKETARVLIAALDRRVDRKFSIKWRTTLESALTSGSAATAAIAISETAGQILPRMAEDFVERGNAVSQAKASPQKLHGFRIASKKFRYTLEIFAPLYGNALSGWLESIKRIQTLLGDINDCATVVQMLGDYKSAGAAAAWLKKRQRRKTEEFVRCWTEEFGDGPGVQSRMDSLPDVPETSPTVKKPMARSRSVAGNQSQGVA